jgi:hypothetical protein
LGFAVRGRFFEAYAIDGVFFASFDAAIAEAASAYVFCGVSPFGVDGYSAATFFFNAAGRALASAYAGCVFGDCDFKGIDAERGDASVTAVFAESKGSRREKGHTGRTGTGKRIRSRNRNRNRIRSRIRVRFRIRFRARIRIRIRFRSRLRLRLRSRSRLRFRSRLRLRLRSRFLWFFCAACGEQSCDERAEWAEAKRHGGESIEGGGPLS